MLFVLALVISTVEIGCNHSLKLDVNDPARKMTKKYSVVFVFLMLIRPDSHVSSRVVVVPT